MPTSIRRFLDSAPGGTARTLQILATAESLTDETARQLYELAPVRGLTADQFLRALHYADFVAPRNSEWNFPARARHELQHLGAAGAAEVHAAHRLLIALGTDGDRSLAGDEIPAYLFTSAGQAYHAAGSDDLHQALSLYGRAASGPLTGAQWLAARLASEQEESGVLPSGHVETLFLRAMVLVREGNRDAAEPLLRRICASEETRIEVAIACHLLGGLVARQRDATHQREAEQLYRRSIAIGEETGNRFHVAQALHSLANLLARDRTPERQREAEQLYRRSIAMAEEDGSRFDVAQRQHSLANLLARDRAPERPREAEQLYRRSIAIGEQLHNRHHLAQTLRSLALLVQHRSPEEAEQLLRRSLDLNQQANDRVGERIVLDSLRRLRERNK